MGQKTFTRVAGCVFLIIAALHALRLILRWDAAIGGWSVPFWVSWAALAVSGYLASAAFKIGR